MTAGIVALTGASGFIGGTVLSRLLRDGVRVRALHRSIAPPAAPPGAVEWIRGSLADGESLERLVRSATAVVHCAGAVRGASPESFYQVNAEGVARLVQAAREAHPRPRFLLISSLAAREPQLSDYAGSKRRGEELLRRGAGGIAWTILRPPAVYGPGDRETRPLLLWLRRGVAPVIAGGEARFSLIHAEDLAAAVAAMLRRPRWEPAVYELHDGHPRGYSWREVQAIAGAVFGRSVRGVRVPRSLLKALAGLNLALARRLGYAPMLTPGKVRELTHTDWVCDNTAITRAFGWKPAIGLAAGLALTLGPAGGGKSRV
jgi:nucleoside-diphosphate-sugar epimerase